MLFKFRRMRFINPIDESDQPEVGSIEALIAMDNGEDYTLDAGGGDDNEDSNDEDPNNSDDGDNNSDDDNDGDDGDNNDDGSSEDDSDDTDDNDDDSVNPLDLLTEQVSNLTNLVAALANKDDKKTVEVETEVEESPINGKAFTELSDIMEWDEDQQKNMKGFLSKLDNFNKKTILAKTLKDMPKLVNNTVTQKTQQKQMYDNFYKENSALKDTKTYVSQVANTVLQEFKNSGKVINAGEILKEAAKRTYKNLGIKKRVLEKKGKKTEKGKKSPSFPNSKGSRKRNTGTKISQDEKMISNIMSLDN